MSAKITDDNLLSEEVGRQRAVNEELERKLSKAQAAGVTRTIFGSLALFVFAVASVMGVGYPLYKCMTMPKVVDSCYVERMTHESLTGFKLTGHVDWGVNIDYGTYFTLDEALAASAKLSCPRTSQTTK